MQTCDGVVGGSEQTHSTGPGAITAITKIYHQLQK